MPNPDKSLDLFSINPDNLVGRIQDNPAIQMGR